jgi:hypothetical protein
VHGSFFIHFLSTIPLAITTEKENLERIDDEDDDDESGYHQHDEDHDDGEIVQHPDAGYQGMQDSPAPADGTLA